MQNPYNNYLKRQKQQPMNNFKEKVKNSLSGKTINNTTLPNTAQSNIQSNIQQKTRTVNPVNAVSPVTMDLNPVTPDVNKVGTGALSGVSTPVETPAQVNTNVTTPNALETPLNVSETPSDAGGAGLMSLSDVNSALAVTPEATQGYDVNSKARSLVYNPLDKNAIVPGTGGMTQAEYEAEVKRKQEAGIALDNQELYNKYLNQSTPYKYAEQILQSQKEQADKNWQLQEQMFQQQQDALNKQYEQSKLEAENAYKQSVDTLNEQKYNQMEELNISGTNRGIQYSPQQLGLENVANINHNKNLVETSNKRNELLNKLQIEMNNSLAQLNMSHLQNYTDYQNKLNDYQNNYYNQLMNWNREDNKLQDERDWEQKLLEEKRKWEEAQAQKDKEFQQMMQELQNKFDKEMQDSQNQFDKDQQTSQNNWQSGENALDREHDITMADKYKSRSSYSSGGGSGYYSNGYYSSGYSKNYNPYSRGYYNGWDSYEGVDLSDDIDARAYQSVFNDVSDDAYNAYTSLLSPYNAQLRAEGYATEVDQMIEDAIKGGASAEVIRNLNNTRDRAMKQLFEDHSGLKNYGSDVIKRGNAKVDFYKKNVRNSLDRMKANQADMIMKRMNANKSKVETPKAKAPSKASQDKTVQTIKKSVANAKKNNATAKANANKNNKTAKENAKKNVKTSVVKAKENNKKAVSNAKKNVEKSTANAKKNVKKSISNAKKNTKKSTNNALKNLKKNIGKLFGKK